MATYYLTGEQILLRTSSSTMVLVRPKTTIEITDYPDRVEGYVDSFIHIKESKGDSDPGRLNPAPFRVNINGVDHNNRTPGTQIEKYMDRDVSVARNSFTIYKTHSEQTITILFEYYGVVTTGTYTIPAKTNYVITLKGNGATGWSDWTMTKWYDENLVLAPTTPPTLDGYNLNGWASTVAKASDGQIDYAVNGTYTTNSEATFYAVWELVYAKPAIISYSIERCKANGDLDDEGRYAKVTVNWEIYKTSLARFYGGSTYPYQNNSAECQIQVGTFSQTVTSTDASGTFSVILGNGSFATDSQYSASITLTDTQTIKTDHSVTVTGAISTSFFPMDFNSTGTALGIFMPAPDVTEGVYLGKDLFLPLDTNVGSGTDHDITVALTSLGWTDVIV